MKKSLNRFALEYLGAVLLGLVLLLLHGAVCSGPLTVFVPQFPSGWELSKLVFWPLLLIGLLSGRLGGGALVKRLPAIAAASSAMALLSWGILSAGGSGTMCLLLWAAALAAALALSPSCGKRPVLWTVLTLALAGLYILLTFTPPAWGPFWNPMG